MFVVLVVYGDVVVGSCWVLLTGSSKSSIYCSYEGSTWVQGFRWFRVLDGVRDLGVQGCPLQVFLMASLAILGV